MLFRYGLKSKYDIIIKEAQTEAEVIKKNKLLEVKEKFLNKKADLETEKPVSSIKAVIVDRFMKKETEKQYVPYCGIIYPFGDSKKQLFFTEQAIHTVIHYGYTDRQEDAYVALIKREIIKKGYSSYSFAEAEDDKIRMLQSDINL